MIISFKNNFIFVKGRKIAGTAIEIALSRICGDADIITPISPGDEALRENWGCGAQNYFRTFNGEDGKPRMQQRYYNHMPLSQVPFDLSNFQTFTVERHPYDKVRSQAAYLGTTFNHILDDLGKCPLNWPLYCNASGKVVVDKIHLYDDLDKLAEEYAIKLPQVKSLHKSGSTEVLSFSQQDKVQKIFEHEFYLHGWDK